LLMSTFIRMSISRTSFAPPSVGKVRKYKTRFDFRRLTPLLAAK
jgi:hypothetical protein